MDKEIEVQDVDCAGCHKKQRRVFHVNLNLNHGSSSD